MQKQWKSINYDLLILVLNDVESFCPAGLLHPEHDYIVWQWHSYAVVLPIVIMIKLIDKSTETLLSINGALGIMAIGPSQAHKPPLSTSREIIQHFLIWQMAQYCVPAGGIRLSIFSILWSLITSDRTQTITHTINCAVVCLHL